MHFESSLRQMNFPQTLSLQCLFQNGDGRRTRYLHNFYFQIFISQIKTRGEKINKVYIQAKREGKLCTAL